MAKNKKPLDAASPFAKLKGLRDELVVEERDRAEQLKREAEELRRKQAVVGDEASLFEEAMAGVRPLGGSVSRVRAKPKTQVAPPKPEPSDDEEVLQELEDLVAGRVPLDFTDSDEFIEGRAADCNRLTLTRLRRGEFSVEANLDLHGMNREEAREAVRGFFKASSARGFRCVNVICGRGLHTPGGKPVLKELLVRWLVQGSLSHSVLAFSSAKSFDGGVGAVYVLLRR